MKCPVSSQRATKKLPKVVDIASPTRSPGSVVQRAKIGHGSIAVEKGVLTSSSGPRYTCYLPSIVNAVPSTRNIFTSEGAEIDHHAITVKKRASRSIEILCASGYLPANFVVFCFGFVFGPPQRI